MIADLDRIDVARSRGVIEGFYWDWDFYDARLRECRELLKFEGGFCEIFMGLVGAFYDDRTLMGVLCGCLAMKGLIFEKAEDVTIFANARRDVIHSLCGVGRENGEKSVS